MGCEGLEPPPLTNSYRRVVRFLTTVLSGFETPLLIPAVVGTATAVITADPRADGFQVQVTVKLVPDPVARRFLHPEMYFPFDKNETLAATLTSAVIDVELLNVATVPPPEIPSEAKMALSIKLAGESDPSEAKRIRKRSEPFDAYAIRATLTEGLKSMA